MIEGSISLVSHTTAGVLNSVSKITGAVGTGISGLSFDKEYMAKREKKKMNKPKNLIDGVG